MDTGNLGESILAKWCHQVDLIPNRVTVDKDGWDFLVALPLTYNNDIKSLDKDDSHDRTLIQVKTTTKERGNRNIKLSNLKKLVDAPIPAFYLLIQVDEDGEPVKAHLFHVWKEIIAKVQEKIRIIPKDKWNRLNNYRLALPWEIAEELTSLNGLALKRIILNNLTNTKKSYSEKKYLLREKVGYEGETGQIHFQGKLPDKYNDDIEAFMVDLYLGEVDKVEVYDWEVTDKRFGHEIVVNKQEGGHFSLTNIEPVGPATIKFLTEDHRSSVEISTEYYIPTGIGQIVKNEKKWKVLYKAPFIKFSIYPKGGRIDFLFDVPDFRIEAKLSELVDITNLMLFFDELNSTEKVIFHISNNGDPFIGGKITFKNYKEKLPLEYFKSIKSANTILNYLNLKTDISINPNELRSQVNRLSFLNNLLSPNLTKIRFEFSTDNELSKYSKTIILYPLSLTIGEYLLPIQLLIQGVPTKTGKIDGNQLFYKLETNTIGIEQYRILSKINDDPKIAHEDMREASMKKYDIDGVMVLYNDEKIR